MELDYKVDISLLPFCIDETAIPRFGSACRSLRELSRPAAVMHMER